MKPEWKQFLIDSGAEFEGDRVSRFGNPERELRASLGGNVFCDLSHTGLISVTGADMESFLQGQITADLRDVMGGRSRLAAHCTHKGRMLSLFRLFRHGGAVYLSLPRKMVEITLKRLRMYLLRADAGLEDAGDALVRLGLVGPDAQALLHQALGVVPSRVDDGVTRGDILVIRVPAPQGRRRYEIHGEWESMKSLWNTLNAQAAPGGAEVWSLCETLSGVPVIEPETVEAFVPQMMNLGLLGGISFDKGCYTGQEVVARMQYRGELKRRMVLLRGTARDVRPGTEIFPSGTSSPVGKVVRAASHPDGDTALLAVIRVAEENRALRLGGPDGPALTLSELPYSLEVS